MKRGDITPACDFATHLKPIKVVAQRGKRVNSPVRHHFVAGFPHAERFLRSVVWGLANDFEVTQAHFTFEAKRTDTGVRVVVWRKYRTRFHTPLNNKKGRSPETRPEPNAWFYCLVRPECTVGNFLQTCCQGTYPVEIFVHTEGRIGDELLSYGSRLLEKVI